MDLTENMFTKPQDQRTEDYITGWEGEIMHHGLSHYQSALDNEKDILKMGSLVEEQINDSIIALRKQD